MEHFGTERMTEHKCLDLVRMNLEQGNEEILVSFYTIVLSFYQLMKLRLNPLYLLAPDLFALRNELM